MSGANDLPGTAQLRQYELNALEQRYASMRNEPYRVIRSLTKFVAELLDVSEGDAEAIVLGRKSVVVTDPVKPSVQPTRKATK
jgi:hypothetical protein